MLGKRPRAMQRSASNLHLLPVDNNHSSLASPSKHHPAVASSPRQVIGFDIAVQMPTLPVPASQIWSPRSPRSGLESLLSRPPSVETETMVARNMTHGDYVMEKCLDTMKISSIAGDQQPASMKLQSQPIRISRKEAGRLERRHSHDDSFHCFATLQSYNIKHEHPFPTDFMEVEFAGHDSIFSTASPASSCSDRCLLVDFLNSCFFCKRQIGQGKDIYMYRGDRAFCSMECRFHQIALDEHKDRCSTSVPTSIIEYPIPLLMASRAAAA